MDLFSDILILEWAMGWIVSSLKRYVVIITQVHQNESFFRSGVFVDATNLRWGPLGVPSQDDWCSCNKRRDTQKGEYHVKTQPCTGTRWPYEDEGKDPSDVATSQGVPGLVEVGRSKEGFYTIGYGGSKVLLTPWWKTSGLQNCKRRHFCGCKPPSLWYML